MPWAVTQRYHQKLKQRLTLVSVYTNKATVKIRDSISTFQKSLISEIVLTNSGPSEPGGLGRLQPPNNSVNFVNSDRRQ